MGRPSRIAVTVTTDDAGADTVRIGGGGRVMSEGEFFL
jgi:predicted PhzF superfamily epimerase YddE/YHI9